MRRHTGGQRIAVTEKRGHRLPGLRIVVVDDSEINCEVAQRILETEGHGLKGGERQGALETIDRLTEIDAVLPRMGFRDWRFRSQHGWSRWRMFLTHSR